MGCQSSTTIQEGSNDSQKGIIILGASGHIGTETVRALVAQGKAVTAGVRDVNTDKSKELAKIGANVIKADMSLPQAQLAATLKRFSTVYLVTPGHIDRVKLIKNATAAAKDAGVTYLLVVSLPTAERTDKIFGKQFNEIEKTVKASGIPFGFFRLPAFMENYFGNMVPIKTMGTYFGSAKASTFWTTVAISDAGLAAAVILSNPQSHINKTYTIVSDGLTLDEAAEAFSRALGRQIKYTNAGKEGTKQALIQAGFADWQADGINELAALPEGGENQYTKLTNDFKALTGKNPISTEAWMRERAKLFSN